MRILVLLLFLLAGCESFKEQPTIVNCKAVCEGCEKCELTCDGVGKAGDTIRITRP